MGLKPVLTVKINSFADMPHNIRDYFIENNFNIGDIVTLMNGHYHNFTPAVKDMCDSIRDYYIDNDYDNTPLFRDMIYVWTNIKFPDGKIIDVNDFDLIWSFASEFNVKGCLNNKYSCFVPV